MYGVQYTKRDHSAGLQLWGECPRIEESVVSVMFAEDPEDVQLVSYCSHNVSD